MACLTHVREVPGHDCDLPKDDALITLYINGGWFVSLRRKFRKFLMVDASSPETKSVLKSSARVHIEEAKQLRKYYYMIHPFSEGRAMWEGTMIVVYFCLFILMPLELAVPVSVPLIRESKFFFDLLSFVDIGLSFSTGYVDHAANKVIMDPKKVFKHYIFSFFLIDLISSLPYNIIISYKKNGDIWYIKLMFLFKLLRLPTLLRYLDKFCKRMIIRSHVLKTIFFCLWIFILLWWNTACIFIIYSFGTHHDKEYFIHERPNIVDQTIECFLRAVHIIMLITLNLLDTNYVWITFYNVICIFLGGVLKLIILAQITQVYRRNTNSRAKYNNVIKELKEYMRYKELPPPLKDKLLQFVDFKFQRNTYKEKEIKKTLSNIIQHDMLLYDCKKLVEKVEFFKGLSTDLLLLIALKLRPEIYLPNDLIVEAGVPGNAMYFVFVGTVAVYLSNGQEICHLEDGSHFGEISLVVQEHRVASVIAITKCELMKLSRKDFWDAVQPYPQLFRKMKQIALARLKSVEKLT